MINFAQPLATVLSSFITDLVRDDSTASPNYVYILFESTALTLTYVKNNKEAFSMVEQHITPALNLILQQQSGNSSEFTSYAFQLYATFVASADQLTDNYALLTSSIMSEQNWQKDLKYLIPALTTFLVTIIAKHPTYAAQHMKQITAISQHLLSVQMRMESSALLIAQTIFERVGQGFDNGEFLSSILKAAFTSLHWYRNNTNKHVIPTAIMKCIHTFFSTLMICNSSKFLVDACDRIQ